MKSKKKTAKDLTDDSFTSPHRSTADNLGNSFRTQLAGLQGCNNDPGRNTNGHQTENQGTDLNALRVAQMWLNPQSNQDQ